MNILVDEFQDTSIIQFHLIKLLSTNSLMVVGDSDQSIYSWRGAYVTAMYDFIKDWDDVQTFYLMENYRLVCIHIILYHVLLMSFTYYFIIYFYSSTRNIIVAAQMIINANDNDNNISISNSNKDLRKNMVPMKGKGKV